MTLYNPRNDQVVDRNPAYSIARSERFLGHEERLRLKHANLPMQYFDHSSFDKTKESGFTMTTGKRWTLKMSKEDETTPGPVYQTQYLGSMARTVDTTEELKNGSFGAFKDKHRVIPTKGFEKAYLGLSSPGPTLYNGSEIAKVKESLSVTRTSQKYSVPRQERFHELKKFIGPSPA